MRWNPRLLALCCALTACPSRPSADAGLPVDAGHSDASVEVDAGRPVRDAGLVDAGWQRVEVSSWCEARARAQCFRDARCGRISGVTQPECVLRRIEGCDQHGWTRGVAEGRLQYLASKAVRCLNDFATGSCEVEPVMCASVFSGLVPPDGGCLSAAECDPRGFCFVNDLQCPHRCRGWAPPGAPCDGFNAQCDPASSVCDARDGGPELCHPPLREGETCQSFSACGPELSCIDSVCTRRTAGAGEVCSARNGYPYCTGELFCRVGRDGGVPTSGTCQLRAGLGATCVGYGSCLPSLRCTTVITTGTCRPKAAVGEGCVAYDDCEDGLFCNQASQQCARLPTDGGDCGFRGSGYRCATGYACDFSAVDDFCVARRAIGAACAYSSLCLSNECVYGALDDGGFGGRCIAPCSQRADGGF